MVVKRVAVLGGGIIGVGSAYRIKSSFPDVEVTIISEKFTPNTTGDVSAGFLMPYSLGEESDVEVIRKWFRETFNFLKEIGTSSEAKQAGVGFIQAYWISADKKNLEENHQYSDVLLNYEEMNEQQLSLFPPDFKFGYTGTSIVAECKRLLPYLTKRFQGLGGKIVTKRVEKLDDLIGSFDVVVNCTGLGAAKIIPDPLVYPTRGQVIKVRAPWIKFAVITDKYHVLPNAEIVTMGGTKQNHNWSLTPDDKDRRNIWKGCCEVIPSLKDAEVVEDVVGLRPTRAFPRLEEEIITKENKEITVIHNYGHGGSGVTLFWGCACDVLSLVKNCF